MNKILVIILLFLFGIVNLHSQNSVLEKKININAKNINLDKFFDQISKQTGYFFTYNPDFISEKTKINYHTKNTSIKTVLNHILSDSSLVYKVIEDHIIICKNENVSSFCKESTKNDNSIIKISGNIINSASKAPIPFASVGILNTTIGAISNENGSFNLKIKKTYIDSMFFVANIGFKTTLITVKKLNTNNTINLTEEFISIQEVIIRSQDPVVILNKAISNIKKNYLQNTSVLSAFYREGVNTKKGIMNFGEAVINVYKAPYKPKLISEKIKIIKSRKIINKKFSDTLLVKLKNGLYSGLQLDIIKHPVDFLIDINKNNYNYQITDIVTYGNKLAYVIDFSQKENIIDALYKGKIYVESLSYAIIACNFEFNFKVTGAKPNFILKKKFKNRTQTESAKYQVSYRSINNQYFLSHVRADLGIKIKQKKHLFYSKYKLFFETVIFNIDTVNIKKFNRQDVEKRNHVFVDNHYSYDAYFWGENNFIKPENSIEKSLKKIKSKLNYSISR